ncbi:unnamed protein product [Eruca vesicaria subsp. sativa]|uniref:Uncharacterized protein n=1 Tax=Eruca vesicaria subsp. sativa TaxID=29727 RepID=A0ABC8K1T0_ERUVS|nr:unnamed protein product [Eruca vesicaria subsp. sativa]
MCGLHHPPTGGPAAGPHHQMYMGQKGQGMVPSQPMEYGYQLQFMPGVRPGAWPGQLYDALYSESNSTWFSCWIQAWCSLHEAALPASTTDNAAQWKIHERCG